MSFENNLIKGKIFGQQFKYVRSSESIVFMHCWRLLHVIHRSPILYWRNYKLQFFLIGLFDALLMIIIFNVRALSGTQFALVMRAYLSKGSVLCSE